MQAPQLLVSQPTTVPTFPSVPAGSAPGACVAPRRRCSSPRPRVTLIRVMQALLGPQSDCVPTLSRRGQCDNPHVAGTLHHPSVQQGSLPGCGRCLIAFRAATTREISAVVESLPALAKSFVVSSLARSPSCPRCRCAAAKRPRSSFKRFSTTHLLQSLPLHLADGTWWQSAGRRPLWMALATARVADTTADAWALSTTAIKRHGLSLMLLSHGSPSPNAGVALRAGSASSGRLRALHNFFSPCRL